MERDGFSIALVGVCGFGKGYLRLLSGGSLPVRQLLAVDPLVRDEETLAFLNAQGVPLFDSLEALYEVAQPDIVIIASPIQFHAGQVQTALHHGSDVLCEKPLTANLKQAEDIRRALQRSGRKLSVGFQLCHSPVMLRLKRMIQQGDLGRPLLFKTTICWPRSEAYYLDSSWRGRRADAQGRPVMDSILHNACAHDLQLMCFLLGQAEREAMVPRVVRGSLHRAYPIETFDTCFLDGAFDNGCRFLFHASHVTEPDVVRLIEYHFEQGLVLFDAASGEVRLERGQGQPEVLGNANTEETRWGAVHNLLASIRNDQMPLCSLDTVMPHLLVVQGAYDHLPIHPFEERIMVQDGPSRYAQVPGLKRDMLAAHRQGVPMRDIRPGLAALSGTYDPQDIGQPG